jgi:hypothetical protein
MGLICCCLDGTGWGSTNLEVDMLAENTMPQPGRVELFT